MGIILRYKEVLKTYKTRGHRLNQLRKYKKWFPVKASESLAGIVGDLISDGNLQGEEKWRIDFTSKSIKELNRFGKEVYKLFRIKGKIRKCTTNRFESYNYGINCSPLSRILFLCGVPTGAKVKKDFKIPGWILENKKFFRRFVQRMFSCEGSILYEPPKKLQIRIDVWKLESNLDSGLRFMEDIAKGLNKFFDMASTITIQKRFLNKRDNIPRRAVRIYLHKAAVRKFYKEIGFEGYKQLQLKKIIGQIG